MFDSPRIFTETRKIWFLQKIGTMAPKALIEDGNFMPRIPRAERSW